MRRTRLHSLTVRVCAPLTLKQDWRSDNFTRINYNFSFYYISSEYKSWNNSRRDCEQRGANLVTINNKEEQEFLQKATSGHYYYWIGLSKEGEVWKWVDGTTLTFRQLTKPPTTTHKDASDDNSQRRQQRQLTKTPTTTTHKDTNDDNSQAAHEDNSQSRPRRQLTKTPKTTTHKDANDDNSQRRQ
nr:C-type lectin domain family 4 member E-like [Misgurnus anguillicaudatus]